MKIGEPCYAVVDENGTIETDDAGGLLVFDGEVYAKSSLAYLRENFAWPKQFAHRIEPVTLLPTSEVARLRKCEAENVKLRELLLKAGHIIDQIAIQTSSVPMFLGILNEISASLTPSGDGETEKSQ